MISPYLLYFALLINTFICILLCYFLKSPIYSFLFLRISFSLFYIVQHKATIFIFKKCMLLAGVTYTFIKISLYLLLLFISFSVVLFFLFFNLFKKFTKRGFFLLSPYNLEIFFVRMDTCNAMDYLSIKLPTVSAFIFLIFHNFRFFRCFTSFYLIIRTEQKRQEDLAIKIKKLSRFVDEMRLLLFQCFYRGWADHYGTFSKMRSEISIFDWIIGKYMLTSRLDAKDPLRYLLMRDIKADSHSIKELLVLKETMDLILLVSDKKKYR